MPETKPLIYDYDQPFLQDLMSEWGEPTYRAKQIWQGIYRQLKSTPHEIPNLPRALARRLEETFAFSNLTPVKTVHSSDGETTKTLFELANSSGIEAVLMRYERRQTLCISTQAGCAMGCVFCATGQMGFRRNLTSGQIIEQIIVYARLLDAQGEHVTNVVLMGMGEPFHNYEQTMAAIDRLNHPEGLNLGARRFTLSTVGLVPQIKRFTRERRQVNLAVSLHAADDELRNSLIPINRKFPLNSLFEACREYVETTHRRLTFEWALIHDINDSPDQARHLADRLRGLLCHVNVIPLNPTRGYSGQATSRQRAYAFKQELERFGIPCTIRIRRGIDIHAGCGQLAIEAVQ
jgi:23S rRNA (adenine2503-C2)-methyltransferase